MSHSRLAELDVATIALIQLAAVIAVSTEAAVREAFAASVNVIPTAWIEELVVQSYLFCGFPRAINAAREWRRVAPSPAPETDEGDDVTHIDEWRGRGEVICAAVYGDMYHKLRVNIRQLHPALDSAMVVEGYGKVLGRAGLDLPRRELCIVAACAATGQDRQLHSHLHGSLNVGVSAGALEEAIRALEPLLGAERTKSVQLLLAKVVGK